MSDDLELIYVGDPMCSWCWGFAPTLERLRERFDIPLRVIVGGLRTDGGDVVDDRMRQFLAEHWEQVENASGQPFDHEILERDGWIYDTEPACRAVVAMREIEPELALPWFSHLQRAFYVEGRDVTDLDELADLVTEFGAPADIDVDKVQEVLRDDRSLQLAREDFALARSWGVHGFPTLLLRDADTVMIVAPGYQRYEDLEPSLRRWLSKRYGEQTAQGWVCDLDGAVC